MKDFFQSWKFRVIICLLALVAGFMIYAAISGGNVIFPKSILETITKPFVSIASSISDWAETALDSIINAEKYHDENVMLREKLSEMYSEILDKQKTDEENEQLRQMLSIAQEHPDYEWSAPCTVIARSAGDIYGSFTINRGDSDGISLHDPVFTSIGLVGTITELSSHYATVTTILSPEVKIGVITAENNTVGIIENDIKYSLNGCCVMNYISKDSKISEGDLIITSGSSLFPKDLVIGTVKEIFDDSNGLTLHAIIEPMENVYSVTNVFVITEFEGQGDAE